MKPNKLLTLASLLICAGSVSAASLNFAGQDVGNPTTKGSVTKNADGTIKIVGGGDDIWNASDNFYYYYTWASGQQWDASVRVRELNGPNEWTKVELMVRASDPTLGPRGGDAFLAEMSTQNPADATGIGVNQIGLQARTAYAAGAINTVGTQSVTPLYPQTWLRIIRNGNVFTLMAATNSATLAGATWYTNIVLDTAAAGAGKYTPLLPDVVAVGIAVTAHDNANVDGGYAVISDLTATFPAITAPTALTATAQPVNATNYAGSEASFKFVYNNNSVPNVLSWPANITNQWYKNGVAIAGATSSVYTALLTPADDGAKIHATATILPPYNTTIQGLTSATGTVTVLPATVYPGGLKVEYFANASRTGVEAGNVGPGKYSLITSFDDPGNYGPDHVRRVSGYFIPPTTAKYTFFVAGDDDTDLFLSTDATPANKKLIAQELGWSGTRNWLTSGSTGANDTTSKRSDQWTDAEFNSAWTVNTALTAGQRYYIEAVLHNGGGGDNLAVTYQTEAQMTAPTWAETFTNGVPTLLTNGTIAALSGPITFMDWDMQPANISVYEGETARFTASVKSDSELAPFYQWTRFGTNVPGATASSFSVGPVSLTDTDTTVAVNIKSAVGAFTLTSPVVKVTVQQAVFEKGFAKVEWYIGKTRPDINNGVAGTPDYVYATPAFEASVNDANGDNFANRISGFVVPATTGLYDFYVNSDDDSDLFLSTNDKPGTKRLIAQEVGWSGPRNWVGQGGGGDIASKYSVTWVDPATTTSPYSAGISLTAGTKYYLELVHHDGTGGDNSSATWKKHADPEPAAGTPSTLTGDVIGFYAPKCTYVAFVKQPSNLTVAPMAVVNLTAEGKTDSLTPVGGINAPITNNFIVYQWQKNGVDIAGATTSSYGYGPVLPTESGTVFTCKIRALGLADAALNPIWSNSAPATLTVEDSMFETGLAKYERYMGATRATVEAGTAGDPDLVTTFSLFEGPQNGEAVNNFAARLSTYFIPATTGKYVFFTTSDDDSDLLVSTDDKPATKRIVAQATAWSNSRAWNSVGDAAALVSQKRSDQWSPDNGATTPYSGGIQLTAGQKYYIEAVMHDGGGGDNVSSTFKLDTDADPTDGDVTKLSGNLIGIYVPRTTVAFAQQPQSVEAETLMATEFNALGVSGNGAGLFYQWFRNNVEIPGATQSKLSLGEVLPADNGAQFMAKVRALGYGDAAGNAAWSNSQTATLTLVAKAPEVTGAFSYVDANTTLRYIDIGFNKRMDPAALGNVANYTLPAGLTATAALVSSDARSVKLTVTGTPAAGATVTVKAGTDAAGSALAANTVATLLTPALTSKDIGNAGDPAFPSTVYVQAPDAYLVRAQGSDIWSAADGFNFLYEQKTGDFDVVVRQKSISHTSNWAKGGLMVREDLTPGSRNWNIVNTPLASDGIQAPDNTGFGTSAVEANYRATTGGDTAGWDSARGRFSDYPNAWLRMKREGQTIKAYISSNGTDWYLAAQNTAATTLPQTVYVGLATTAHNNDPVGTPADQQVYWNTATYADYDSSYVAAAPSPTLSTSVNGDQLTISWLPANGTLQQNSTLTGGTWTTVPSTGGSATVTIGTGNMFFRVLQ